MAYAIVTLSKDENTETNIETPIGFSFETLFPPLIASMFGWAIASILLKLAFPVGESEFSEGITGTGILLLAIYSLIFVINLVSVAYAPLSRNDKKWANRMMILAILTAGLSIFYFAFFYNRIYLKDRFKEGYKIVEIYDAIPSRASSLTELNPFETSSSTSKPQLWIERFGIAWIKEFPSIEEATDYISQYPERCLKIRAIAKVANEKGNLISEPERFVLPIAKWAKEASTY